MNKTVTINLGGIVFHIDEDAYLKLQGYLNAIKGHFSESDGRDEILSDIEIRIAEMLSEKISNSKQAILISDIDYVIGRMGRPEDFADDNSSSKQASNDNTKKEYPPYSTITQKHRRIFRDPDNKILGGVCSGISAYFNIDSIWLRLILAVSLFIFGSGFILYFILWVIIPEAKTTTEKLEMRGEEVNFSNIGKKVEEEMYSFGKKVESWGQEVNQSATSEKGRAIVNNIADFLSTIFGLVFRVSTKLLGIFLVVIGLIFLVVILSSVIGGINIMHIQNGSFSLHDIFFNFFDNENQIIIASLALILLFGIPLIIMVYGGVKLLLGIKGKNRFINLVVGILWIVGVALAIITGIQIGDQFSEKATGQDELALTKTKCDTLFLKMKEADNINEPVRYRRKRLPFVFYNHHLFSSDSTNYNFGFPTIDIIRGESNTTEVIIYNEAYGKDRKEALHFARTIKYDIVQKDSLLEFMPYYSIPKDEKWRNQKVHVEILLPKNKIVYIGKNMDQLIYDIQNETDTWDGDMVGKRWMMGEEQLRCIDCKDIDPMKNRRRSLDTDSPPVPTLPPTPPNLSSDSDN